MEIHYVTLNISYFTTHSSPEWYVCQLLLLVCSKYDLHVTKKKPKLPSFLHYFELCSSKTIRDREIFYIINA